MVSISKTTVWTETVPPRCTGMMLNDRGIDQSITSTDDILFNPDYTYTRVVRVALMDRERTVSEVAAFTGPYNYTRAEIVDGVQGWAFIVGLSRDDGLSSRQTVGLSRDDGLPQGQSSLNALMSLTKADRRLIMDRLVRSAAEYNGNVSYVMGIRDAVNIGEIKVTRDKTMVFGARAV